ncbi:AMP-binding protein [Nocardia cyriacigeorgica]|uniref:AMP-binding protein n=1 Tax=Nocardia cyriacigeorgica TaxID=135487 RepID=UPI00245699DE|nr:AMP-binding protein [Nocardia cyriacigeorgica]
MTTTPSADQQPDIARMLMARIGDEHLGLRTRQQDWTWDAVVRESATRAALAQSLRVDGPFHIGVLLDNVPDFVFWLGGAALAGATVVGINPTHGAAELREEVRFVDCQLIVTDRAGALRLRELDLGLGYLMATPETPHDRDNRLERGFGTEAAPADRAEFARRFGAPLLEAYGSSEGAGSVRLDPDAPAGALGRPAHSGIAVVDPSTLRDCAPARLDEHGRVLNSDEAVGEMVNKDGAATFEGYYNNPAADAERVRNGWYWTGDLGYIDEAGFLYFAGRRGDWIRVDGENTSALLIEQVVRRHPAVLATAAYAVPDPRSGDLVMAAIETRDPEVFDPIAFASFLAEQVDLGRKATPRLLRVSSALPVTGSGKIVKRELQQQKWRTTDAVYRWNSGAYQLMSESDKAALEREFVAHHRQRLL